MKINPMSLKFLFEEELFFFSNESISPAKNNKGFIGENNSNISILSTEELSKDDLAFLEKILLALKLGFSDVAIKSDKNKDIKEFLTTTKPNKLILFGTSPFEAGYESVTVNTYEIVEVDAVKILQAENFSKYLTAADKKKALWFALQKLFT